MDENYRKMLAHLKRVKADAESGIAAIERLAGGPDAPPEPRRSAGRGSAASIPQRITDALAASPGRAVTISEIIAAARIAEKDMPTLRSAIGRLHKQKKILRHGRGKYKLAGQREAKSPKPAAARRQSPTGESLMAISVDGPIVVKVNGSKILRLR